MERCEKLVGLRTIINKDIHVPAALTLLAGHFVNDASTCRAPANVARNFHQTRPSYGEPPGSRRVPQVGRALTAGGMPFVSKSSRTKAGSPAAYIILSPVRAAKPGETIRRILGGQIDFAPGSLGRMRPKAIARCWKGDCQGPWQTGASEKEYSLPLCRGTCGALTGIGLRFVPSAAKRIFFVSRPLSLTK